MADITQAQLHELFNYNPTTGVFTRRIGRGANDRWPSGTRAGSNSHGRWRIHIGNRDYFAYRLAFLYVLGRWPYGLVDHVDGDPSNDAWENLRDCSQSENLENLKKAKTGNKSGLLGAHKNMKASGYMARITVRGVQIYLGNYPTAQEAHEVYITAKRKLHKGCTI